MSAANLLHSSSRILLVLNRYYVRLPICPGKGYFGSQPCKDANTRQSMHCTTNQNIDSYLDQLEFNVAY